MRVTSQMIIRSMTYYMSQQLETIDNLATQNSTGKKVNSPSDDPAAAGQILSDRTTLSQYGQYLSNISQLQNYVEAGETVLDAVYSILAEAEDAVFEQASGDLSTRQTAIESLEAYYDELVALANTRYNGEYMYSGDEDDTTPFANETTVTAGWPKTLSLTWVMLRPAWKSPYRTLPAT